MFHKLWEPFGVVALCAVSSLAYLAERESWLIFSLCSCLFLFDLIFCIPVNNVSIMSGWVFWVKPVLSS